MSAFDTQPHIARFIDEVRNAMRVPRGWNMDVMIYNESTNVPVTKNCFAFMFTNVGDSIGYINDIVVYPSATPGAALGDSRTISGHLLDVYKGTMNLKITPVLAAPAIEVVQLFYFPHEFKLSSL
jgi:hypothetical protein